MAFAVQLGDDKAAFFQEVTGLQTEAKPIEYRHGDSAKFAPVKMSELVGVGHVTLKRGVVAKDSAFYAWCLDVERGSLHRRVVITLRDDSGATKMAWTLNNAWPSKIEGPSFNASSNEVAIESIELAFEGLEVNAPRTTT